MLSREQFFILIIIHNFNNSNALHAYVILQESEQFFETFFDSFPFDSYPGIRRHLHEGRKYAIGFPESGMELDELKEIKNCIAKIVQNSEYSEENVRPAMAIFEQILRKEKQSRKIILRKTLLSYNEQLSEEFRMADDEISRMLIFLHRVGTLLYIEEDGLEETVILDIEWFVDAFKRLVNYPVDVGKVNDLKRKHFQFTGELEENDLKALWKTCSDQGKSFFNHKTELMYYMERLGLLAIYNSEKAVSGNYTWYYIPSMNKRKFDKTGTEFLKSPVICFHFNEHGQVPIKVFHGVVIKCFNIPEWSIYTEKNEKQRCLYENAACFSFKSHIVVLWTCRYQISVQIWDTAREDICLTLFLELKKSLEGIIRKFKKYSYEVCHKYKYGLFNTDDEKIFTEQERFPLLTLLNKRLDVDNQHNVDNPTSLVG